MKRCQESLNDSLNNTWENFLMHQFKEIPNFENAFKKVIKIMNQIKVQKIKLEEITSSNQRKLNLLDMNFTFREKNS